MNVKKEWMKSNFIHPFFYFKKENYTDISPEKLENLLTMENIILLRWDIIGGDFITIFLNINEISLQSYIMSVKNKITIGLAISKQKENIRKIIKKEENIKKIKNKDNIINKIKLDEYIHGKNVNILVDYINIYDFKQKIKTMNDWQIYNWQLIGTNEAIQSILFLMINVSTNKVKVVVVKNHSIETELDILNQIVQDINENLLNLIV